MFRFPIFYVILLSGFSLFGQETQTRSLKTFHALRVEGPVDVRLIKGSAPSVRIETKGFPTGKVEAEVTGFTLRIALEGSVFRNNSKVDVWVTYKDLDRISASGAGNIFGNEMLRTKFLELEATSAATIEVEAEADRVSIESSTAGQVIIGGKTNMLEIDCTTSAGVDAYRLSAEEVNAGIKTAGSAKVHVLKAIEAEVSTAGSLRYRGSPERSNLQSATGGSIRKAD